MKVPQPEAQISNRHTRAKAIAFVFWLMVLGGYYGYIRQASLTLEESVSQIAVWLTDSFYGPLLFILLYVVGPLLFFPATILSLLGGFLFGPVGIAYTIIGSNASAMMAYSVGRYFGQGVLEHRMGFIEHYAQRIRENSFETILIMHLLFMPYELVNYAGGFFQIQWKAFLMATALGSLPATISIVLMGASFGSLEELMVGEIHLNPGMLGTSIFLISAGIALSQYLKKREVARK